MKDVNYEYWFLSEHGLLPEQAIERIKELEAELAERPTQDDLDACAASVVRCKELEAQLDRKKADIKEILRRADMYGIGHVKIREIINRQALKEQK